MRDDLAVLRRAVFAVTRPDDDQDAAAAIAALGEVSFRDPAWSLRRYCAHFCRFVHDHHSVEDTMLFPVLLAHEHNRDELATVIRRLQDDHRTLSRHLDEVEDAMTAAAGDDAAKAAAAKAAAVEAIERLAGHLEAHLALEEETLAPALNALSEVVAEDDLPPPDGSSVTWRSA